LRREDLPSDPDQLAELALALAAENERLRAALQSINTLHFGTKSERLVVVVDEQMTLGLGDLATDTSPPPPANDDVGPKPKSPPRPSRKPARRNIGALPKHLPRCEQVIEPDSTICPCCTGQMHRIGECVHEALDVVPAILRVLRTVRPKYGCRSCESAVVPAPARSRLIEAGMASTALVSWVVVSKFAWHMPLNRQTQMLAGYGVTLDRSTLVHWVDRTAWWLEGLYDLQLKTIHGFPQVFCDDRPRRRSIRCRCSKRGNGEPASASSGRTPWTTDPGKARHHRQSCTCSPPAAVPMPLPGNSATGSPAFCRSTAMVPTRRWSSAPNAARSGSPSVSRTRAANS
jgi:transposase